MRSSRCHMVLVNSFKLLRLVEACLRWQHASDWLTVCPALPPPLFYCIVLQNEAALAEFASKLRNFRPAATVLEAEIASVKSTFTNPLLDADALRSKSTDVSWGQRGWVAAVETDVSSGLLAPNLLSTCFRQSCGHLTLSTD